MSVWPSRDYESGYDAGYQRGVAAQYRDALAAVIAMLEGCKFFSRSDLARLSVAAQKNLDALNAQFEFIRPQDASQGLTGAQWRHLLGSEEALKPVAAKTPYAAYRERLQPTANGQGVHPEDTTKPFGDGVSERKSDDALNRAIRSKT